METTSEPEREPLLQGEAGEASEAATSAPQIPGVLPVAFAAAFAIAATSATTIFAYAIIICEDPAHCKDGEQSHYSGASAFAASMANVLGIVTITVLGRWVQSQPRLGLGVWLASRGIGIIIVAIGVLLRNIYVAIAGQVFEGLATDNLLHFALASNYLRADKPGQFSRLMGLSLALYMVGMSLGPTIVAVLPNFVFSFFIAAALLGLSLGYLVLFVPRNHSVRHENHEDPSGTAADNPTTESSFRGLVRRLKMEPNIILPGMAMLLFNCSQAYLFPGIMIYASTRFGFTSKENSYLISIAASTSAVYLFIVHLVVPRVRRIWSRWRAAPDNQDDNTRSERVDSNRSRDREVRSTYSRDFFFAFLSMSIPLLFLPLFTAVSTGSGIYGLVVVIALGLASPSFIKSYGVMAAKDKASSLTLLAVFESIGGWISPVVLGTCQTLLGQGSIFVVSSSLVGAAMFCLLGSVILVRK